MKSAFFLLLFAVSFAIAGDKPATKEYVAVKVTVKEKSLKPGATGTLLISLKPEDGIHINLTPPMSAKVDTGTAFALTGTMKAPAKSDNAAYFDWSKKIEQPFTVSKSVKPGKLMLKGTFAYFFCSDAEGWCNRTKTPFEVSIAIGK